ncbi:hypothetical protein RJ640_028647, partial [Escallonia rubra]
MLGWSLNRQRRCPERVAGSHNGDLKFEQLGGGGATNIFAVQSVEKIELRTAPADFRFPTTNQSRHCFTRYIEFHRCLAAKGEESGECERFAKYYRSLCPGEW